VRTFPNKFFPISELTPPIKAPLAELTANSTFAAPAPKNSYFNYFEITYSIELFGEIYSKRLN